MLEHIKTDGTETGLSSAEKINLCFTQCDDNAANIVTNSNDIAQNTTDIQVNATNIELYVTDIQTNADNIVINSDKINANTILIQDNIGTNATNIENNTQDIADLNLEKVNKEGDIMTGMLKGLTPVDDNDFATKKYIDDLNTFDYQKRGSVSNVGDTYTPLCDMTTPPRDAGTYVVSLSGTYTFNQTNKSAFVRFSLDDGGSWFEFRREPKDNSDLLPLNYSFPYNHSGGAFRIMLQARKEDNIGTMNFQYIYVSCTSKPNANHIPY